jgi:hypothetical protein
VVTKRRLDDLPEQWRRRAQRSRALSRRLRTPLHAPVRLRSPHQLRRPRPRSRRTAARRAAGLRSGQDPGDDDGESEPAGDLAPLADRRRTPGGRP